MSDHEHDAGDKEAESKYNGKNNNVGRAILLADVAHPPIPYIRQGAREKPGSLSMLLNHYCLTTVNRNDNDS